MATVTRVWREHYSRAFCNVAPATQSAADAHVGDDAHPLGFGHSLAGVQRLLPIFGVAKLPSPVYRWGMAVATLPRILSTQDAAEELGVTDGRVRQILRALDENGRKIGTKAGNTWVLTMSDVEFIRHLPDGRATRSEKKSAKNA